MMQKRKHLQNLLIMLVIVHFIGKANDKNEEVMVVWSDTKHQNSGTLNMNNRMP